MRWQAFVEDAGELGILAVERLIGAELCLLGTLRANGWPRISPCEVYPVDGELLLGMMWRSRKALDLLRDPRVTVHSVQNGKSGTIGDVKLYGTVIDVSDPVVREKYGDMLEARIDWRPTEPFHLFTLDIREAGFISFGESRRTWRWREGEGLVPLRHPDG